MTFQILTDSSLKPIVNVSSLAPEKIMTAQDLKKVKYFLKDHRLDYIVDKEFAEKYLQPQDTMTGFFPGCDTVVIDNGNIGLFDGARIDNAILFVDDEISLFDNFFTIAPNVHGFIDLRTKELNRYNMELLYPQLLKICKYIEITANYSPTVVKQLSGFMLSEKFQDYGFDTFFVSPDLNIWCHPKFYYLQDMNGLMGSVIDTEINNDFNHFTRPHLICESCETFYCDRDVYKNLTEAGDIKTPALSTCADTQLFSKLSKELYTRITGEHIPDEKLERSETFNPEEEFDRQVKNQVMANNIKRINFMEDHIHGQQNRLMRIEDSIGVLTRLVQEMYNDRQNNR